MNTPSLHQDRLALDLIENDFLNAQTPAHYAAVRDEAIRLRDSCRGLEAFQAAVLAADCVYWAAMARSSRNVVDLVEDLARLQPLLDSLETIPQPLMERFVSLLDVVIRLSLGSHSDSWPAMATLIDRYIPVDFQFSPSSGSDWLPHTVHASGSLASACFRHGDQATGENRYRAAMKLLADTAEPPEFCELSQRLYDWAHESWQERPQLIVTIASIQSQILRNIDLLRAKYKSRAGRIWLAQMFTELISQFQRDMAEPELPHIPAELAPPLFDFLRSQLFLTMEAGKSRLLLDYLIGGVEAVVDPAASAEIASAESLLLALPPTTMKQTDFLRREYQLVSRLPMWLWQNRSIPTKESAAVAHKIKALEALFDSDSGFRNAERPASLDDIAQELTETEAIIEYAIPRETLHPARKIHILGITKQTVRQITVDLDVLNFEPFDRGSIGSFSVGGAQPIEESPLGELIFKTRIAIQRSETEPARAYLKLLHMILIRPLLDIGIDVEKMEHLHLVPHGMLHHVPFGALIDSDGKHLIEKTALSTAPSASVWLTLRQPWPDAPIYFAGFGNPHLDSGLWRPLPNTEKEIRSAKEKLNPARSEMFFDSDATLDNLATQASDCTILHLASHGDFPEANVIDAHQILLTPGTYDDGRVTAEFVRRLDLRKNQLAVLSVCDGGLTRVGPGDELYGLVPAFLEAGSSNVLTTLWQVDDSLTKLWMREFYKTLAASGPAKSLATTCRVFISDGASIRDWAAFLIVGTN